jgi:DNA-binding CsgD family transcriptional regulator
LEILGVVVSDLNKFIEWLSYNPSYEEIAQALVLEFLSDIHPSRVRFGKTLSDDSAVVLGQYGYPDPQVPLGISIPGNVWRSLDTPDIKIISGIHELPWSPEGDVCVVVLRDHGKVQGHAVFEFDQSVREEEKGYVLGRITDYCILVSLYVSLLSRGNDPVITRPFNSLVNSRVGSLSPRQLEVLRGLVAGKSNIQIARQLGYSISTVRQETIKIYSALSVSGRREAAQKALELSLL